MKQKLLADYGMLGVLLLLVVFFTGATWGTIRPAGAPAARAAVEGIAGKVDKGNVLVIAPPTTDSEVFLAEAEKLLAAREGYTVVKALRGEPFEIRAELEKLAAENKPIDAIICHPVAYQWTIFDRLAKEHPEQFGKTIIITAAPVTGSSFLTPSNLLNIANQNAVIAIIAIGMTMVIITGGIDLSVGSLVALSAVATTWLIREYGGGKDATTLSMILAAAGGLAACAAIGAFNGFMITRFRIPAFIVTLSVMLIASGIAGRWSNNQTIDAVPEAFMWLGRGTVLGGIPNAVILMLVLYVIAHLVMSRTVIGRHIYAVGGNQKAAWLSGVPVNRVLMTVYIVGAVLAGLGGIVMASLFKSGSQNFGTTYEMFVIAAVVVGGTSLLGGEGRMFGTFVGSLIIAVINVGMNQMGIPSDFQRIVLGALILGAVLLDQMQRGAER